MSTSGTRMWCWNKGCNKTKEKNNGNFYDRRHPRRLRQAFRQSLPGTGNLDKNDCVMICDDFGGIWDGGESSAGWRIAPLTTLFVDGSCENMVIEKKFVMLYERII